MKKIIFSFSLIFAVAAHAEDLFQFADGPGYERCLRQPPPKVGKHSMEKLEIIEKCLVQAEKTVAANPKDLARIKAFLEITRVNSAPENALAFVGAWIKLDLHACEDPESYDILMLALGHPDAYPSNSHSFAKISRGLVKQCLMDADFKKDAIEELETNDDSYVKKNLCQILTASKLVKKC